jgi:hypothetical protein
MSVFDGKNKELVLMLQETYDIISQQIENKQLSD